MTVAVVLRQKGSSVIAVRPDTTVGEVADVIASRRIGAVVVLDPDGRLAGIVSERDVVKALSAHRAAALEMTAKDLMTRAVITATPETTVTEALEMMDAGYFRHLPVLGPDGRPAGIISIRDLVKYRMMLQEHEVESMKAYVTRAV